MQAQITFDPAYARSHYIPISDGTINLGSSSFAFANSYINNLRSGAASGLTLRATSANISMYTSGLSRWEVDTSGRFTQDVTNGGDIVFNKTDSLLRFGTSDGSDNKTMYLCGGGSYGGSRGGTIRLDGNESANAGSVTIEAGVTTGSRIYFKTNSLDIWRMNIGGTFEQNATNGSDIVFNVTASGIRMGTSDGADNKELVLTGGGAMEAVGQCNRGAKLVLAGLEHATRPGESYLEANYIKLRAFNSGYVITQTDNLLFRNAAGSNVWTIVSGVLAQDGTNGSDLVFNTSTGIIRQGTSDAADNKVLVVAGGGGISTSRGATVSVYGNESAGGGGAIALTGGAVSTGYINFDLSHASATVRVRNSSGGELWAFNNSGQLVQNSTNGSNIIFNVNGGGLLMGTSDGADNKILMLSGGGAMNSSSRGAFLTLAGNEATATGQAVLGAGNVSGAYVRIATYGAYPIQFYTNGVQMWSIDSSGRLVQDSSNGGDLLLSRTNPAIMQATVDGSDNCALSIGGGGGIATTRGSYVKLYGNEHASTGKVEIYSGNVSGGSITIESPNSSSSNITIKAGSDLDLRGGASAGIKLYAGGSQRFEIFSSGEWACIDANAIIRQATNDGSDNGSVQIAGGGGTSATRGAYMAAYGNEYGSSISGDVDLRTGDAANAEISLRAVSTTGQVRVWVNGANRWVIDNSGHLAQDTTDGGLLIFNKANTTMRFNGAMGNSTKVVGTDAPADWVEINIAGTTYYLPAYAA